MENNYLKHYGVLGMKWGVRRGSSSSRTGSSRRKKKGSSVELHEDYKKAHDKKSVKSMSDAELRNRLNRLNMERQYSQLGGEPVNKGRSYANKIMKAGTTVAAVTTTGLTIYNNADKIRKIIEKATK